MNIAVYSDKFSGTLSASEVIGTVKELFQNNSIEAAYFPVTDGGEDSTKIFKEYGITVKQSLKIKDLNLLYITLFYFLLNSLFLSLQKSL